MCTFEILEREYYVLMVRCGAENKIREQMEEKGYKAVCPSFVSHRKIRHRKSESLVEIIRPVLDGYLFVESREGVELKALKAFGGVLKVVSFGGEPALMSEGDLAQVTRMVESLRLRAEVDLEKTLGKKRWPKDLKVGEAIRIVSDDFSVSGIYVGGNHAEVIMFGAPIKITIKSAYVERIVE